MMMAVGTLIIVQHALRWFVDNFSTIAEWRATFRRIASSRDVLVTAAELCTTKNQIASVCPRPWLVGIAMLLLGGCSSPERLPPVPDGDTFNAQPLGIPDARFFPTADLERMVAEGGRSIERQRSVLGLAPNAPLPAASLLAISGGGDNGAFASGLLVGWTQAGDRPEFQVVTGISSGALAAPFAYLGSDYDGPLRDVYTTITADDVFRERGLIAAIFGDAMADTTPLWTLISKYVDEKLMAGIAREYEKGRLLLIGTTDLDSEQPVLWNIGAIAASGRPGALDLFRKVLRASSAVPGIFEPVLIDVEVRGKAYQELHVDGGAIAQMFLYPPNIEVGQRLPKYERKAYLIRNGRLDAEWAEVEPRTLSIVRRTISTLTHYGGANDVLTIYFIAQRDGVDYNLAYIGRDFKALSAGDFDKVYMNALFNYAYQQARKGYSWRKIPPILAGQQN
jgi:predicted patatin/cPLA2 family phospholipase